MSIFRATLKPGVQEQLRVRQKAIANRNPTSIHYLNSRNAWVKLTSSVDVGGDKGASAKQNILLGGILGFVPKSGIGNKPSNAYSTVTSGGAANRLGIRPMPGITSIDVQSKQAYGSLRVATVNFVTWDIKQLEELELLYMRPGYTVLLEWGWLPYLDNSGKLLTSVDFTDIIDKIPSQEELYLNLFNKAQINGNYEAMYGKIQNYSWKARSDGGYDCTTTIVTVGEIIDSLKVNYSPFHVTDVEKTGVLAGTLKNFDQKRLTTVQNQISGAYSKNIVAGVTSELYALASTFSGTAPMYKLYDEGTTITMYRSSIKQFNDNVGNTLNGTNSIYITLESLIHILNKYVILEAKDKDGKRIAPYVSLSVSSSAITSDKSPLLCLGNEYQISTNPAVCLIANQAWSDPYSRLGVRGVDPNNVIKKFIDDAIADSKGYFYNDDWVNQQYGVIGNIFVNLNYIYSLSTNNNVGSLDKKEKNDISLYTFIKTIMNDVNTAIGNVANFDIHVDGTDGNVARIIDVNYVDVDTRQGAYDKAFTFELQRVNSPTGSIIRNYSFESQIFPEQSAIVAIGAQIKGGALGTDSNTLIDFHQNLIDRILPGKAAPGNSKTTTTDEADFKTYQGNLSTLVSFINKLGATPTSANGGEDNTYNVSESALYSNALRDIINFFKSVLPNNNKNRAIIPTKLSFELDGISGLVIGNMFKIPLDVLPRGYKGDKAGPAKIGFLITRVGHSIQNNDWLTKVESQFVILDEPRGLPITAADRAKLTLAVGLNDFSAAKKIVNNAKSNNSMVLAGNTIFNTNGEAASKCARYTYNIARAYNEAVSSNTVKDPSVNSPADGNANDLAYRKKLITLGYSGDINNSQTLTRDQLIQLVQSSNNWNVGDIVNYRSLNSTDESGKSHAYSIGHTQIFTGGGLDASPSSVWASSFIQRSGIVYPTAAGPFEVFIFRKK